MVEALSRDGDRALGTGTLTLVDNQINQNTATIRLKAVFPNPAHTLWPNQFVKTRLRLECSKGALVVPAAAVQRGPQGTFVYVVGEDGKAAVKPIQIDTIEGATALLTGGVETGDRVVTEGQNQLRPGARVSVRQPGNREARRPRGCRGRGGPWWRRQARGIEATEMNVSEPFIRRPIGTSLLMVGVLIAGAVGYRQLPVAALPQVDYPTIAVTTLLPGASAETMVSAVTTPLERQLGQIPSLAQLTSVSSAATSLITLQFTLDRDIDAAEQDVQAAINAASNLLPRTLPTPPTYSKSNPADVPVIALGVSSDTAPLERVDDYADSILAQKISQVSGVGLVTLNGGQRPAVRVQVDPVALAGRGLSLEDVRAVLVAANVNQPKGNLDGPRLNYTIAANDQLQQAAGLPAAGGRLPQRRADPAVRRGAGARRRRELAAGRLGQRPPRRDPERAAPAGRQPDPGRRSRQGAAGRSWRRRCRRGSRSRSSATAPTPCARRSTTCSSRCS